VLIASQMDIGASLVDVAHSGGVVDGDGALALARAQPLLQQFRVHDGFAYGFDGGILCCADFSRSGQRAGRKGRYDYAR